MEEEHSGGHGAGAGDYIQHHLTNLQVCRVDGRWVWNDCAGNFWGVNVDSMFFAVLGYIIDRIEPLHDVFDAGVFPHIPNLIGATLLLVTLIQFPGGIGQQISPVTQWLNGRPFSLKAHHETGVQAGGAGVRP